MGKPRGKIIQAGEQNERIELPSNGKGVTPESLAKTGTEHGHQAALFCWAAHPNTRNQYPELEWMFAIPNGGDRDAIVGAMMKTEGVKAGVFDLCLPVARGGWFGLYIEMKKPNARHGDHRDMSEKQKAFGMFVHQQGYKTELCHSYTKARSVIEAYLAQARTIPCQTA